LAERLARVSVTDVRLLASGGVEPESASWSSLIDRADAGPVARRTCLGRRSVALQ
jgi:hypothetical protein